MSRFPSPRLALSTSLFALALFLLFLGFVSTAHAQESANRETGSVTEAELKHEIHLLSVLLDSARAELGLVLYIRESPASTAGNLWSAMQHAPVAKRHAVGIDGYKILDILRSEFIMRHGLSTSECLQQAVAESQDYSHAHGEYVKWKYGRSSWRKVLAALDTYWKNASTFEACMNTPTSMR